MSGCSDRFEYPELLCPFAYRYGKRIVYQRYRAGYDQKNKDCHEGVKHPHDSAVPEQPVQPDKITVNDTIPVDAVGKIVYLCRIVHREEETVVAVSAFLCQCGIRGRRYLFDKIIESVVFADDRVCLFVCVRNFFACVRINRI